MRLPSHITTCPITLSPRTLTTLALATAAALHAPTTPTAHAAVLTWDTTTGDWFTDTNWNPIALPAPADALTINANGEPTAAAPVTTTNTININTGAHATFNAGLDFSAGTLNHNAGTITINDSAFVPPAGTFKIQGLFNAPASTLALNNATMNLGTDSLFVAIDSSREGHLQVNAASQVTSGLIRIGNFSGTVGTVTVDGGELTGSAGMVIGAIGDGTLHVINGGVVTNAAATISSLSGAPSSATVASGGIWNNDSLTIGGTTTTSGGSADLNINAGGTVNVDGPTKVWNSDTINLLGGTLNTDSLDTTAPGATLNWTTGTLGFNNNLTIDTAQDLGSAVTLIADQTLNVTNTTTIAAAGTLNLNGGAFNTGSLDVANGLFTQTAGTFSFNDQLTVGADGLFDSNATLTIPQDGTLTVNSDAQLDAAGLVAANPTSTINVAGGKIKIDGPLTLTGGAVANGADWGNIDNFLATFAPGVLTAQTATITGTNSLWTMGTIIAGRNGTGTMSVTDGGRVDANRAYIGEVAGSNGQITVGGPGANADLDVGSAGLFIGGNHAGDGGTGTLTINTNGTVNVNGQTKLWTNGTINLLGGTLNTNSLDTTTPGATFNWTTGTLGFNNNLTIDTAQDLGSAVTLIADQTLNVTNTTTLSLAGTINLNGGAFNTGSLDVANGLFTQTAGTFSFNDQLTVGADGLFDSNATLTIPQDGTLTVNSDGQLDAAGLVAANPTSTINLNGGNIKIDGPLTIAGGAVANGAIWANVDSFLALLGPNTMTAQTATITGTNSLWTMGTIIAGRNGTGTMSVTDGGRVDANRAYIGEFGVSDGQITVGGPGANADLDVGSSGLFIGGNNAVDGGTGTLTINTNGTVNVNGQTKLWTKGTINLLGGTLNTNSLDTTTPGATFNFPFGTLNITADTTIDTALAQPIGPAKTLAIAGTATLTTPLTLDGGTFSAGSLINPFFLDFQRGTFALTTDNLDIAPTGLFGDNLRIDPDQTIQVTNNILVATGALLQLNDGNAQADTLTNAGLIRGTGRIDATLNNQPGGEVRIAPADTLTIANTAHTNDGDIVLLGGELQFIGTLTNTATGNILGRGTLITDGLTNHGDLAISNNQTDIFGDVTNQAASTTTISGNADTTFWGNVTNDPAIGLFRVAAGSSATFFGTLEPGPGISGTGDVFVEADVNPGASPGVSNFGGTFAFGPSATLNIELGGLTPGPGQPGDTDNGYDQINITGAVALDGTLNIQLINNFNESDITPGDIFTLLTWNTNPGATTFSAANLPALPTTPGLTLLPTYNPNALTLNATATPGDANLDGLVTLEDLVILAANFDQTVGSRAWRQADFNLDTLVNAADLQLAAPNFTGNPDSLLSLATALGVQLTQQTPEPTTLLTLLLLTPLLINPPRRVG